jgi:hypothetical protein
MTRHVPQQARAPISERPAGFFVGIDWATQAHAVCVIDETAHIQWHGSVAHTAAGLTELLGRLRRFRHRGALRVALERPSGLLVDTLIGAGLEVVPIHPNALKASRPRSSAQHPDGPLAHSLPRSRAVNAAQILAALRILARARARILWRCWQDRTPYDVRRHRAAQALAAA